MRCGPEFDALGDEIDIEHVRKSWPSRKPLVRKGIPVGQLGGDVLADRRASNQRDRGFFGIVLVRQGQPARLLGGRQLAPFVALATPWRAR